MRRQEPAPLVETSLHLFGISPVPICENTSAALASTILTWMRSQSRSARDPSRSKSRLKSLMTGFYTYLEAMPGSACRQRSL